MMFYVRIIINKTEHAVQPPRRHVHRQTEMTERHTDKQMEGQTDRLTKNRLRQQKLKRVTAEDEKQ